MSEADAKVKRPASQYYWGDWWKDKGLHSCSLTARGLWHEMNCLMHEGEPYGHLTLNGKPMTVAQLANQSRITPSKCKALLDELEVAGVFSRHPLGTIFSRRMVRDEKIREARAAGGKAGAEHGIKGAGWGKNGGRPKGLKGGLETPLPGLEKPPPSSSSSSSSSPSGEKNPSGSVAPVKPARKAKGSKRVPADFTVPVDLQTWAAENAPLVDWRRETEKFRDWEFKHARTDWSATWRTWMRNAQESAEKAGAEAPASARKETFV